MKRKYWQKKKRKKKGKEENPEILKDYERKKANTCYTKGTY